MTMMMHPAITGVARPMSPLELAFFSDEPQAHAGAFADYIKARQIETRNAEIAEYCERNRDRIIARAFVELMA